MYTGEDSVRSLLSSSLKTGEDKHACMISSDVMKHLTFLHACFKDTNSTWVRLNYISPFKLCNICTAMSCVCVEGAENCAGKRDPST